MIPLLWIIEKLLGLILGYIFLAIEEKQIKFSGFISGRAFTKKGVNSSRDPVNFFKIELELFFLYIFIDNLLENLFKYIFF